ncbi:Bgr_08870 family protein [Bartonella bovis]|uniref:Bgr_08870 family protein n=1 Tax=Bartonella bovis TaxID=155194 RepID=UPI001ABA7F78|nr:Bgr_08870 family protein [Bartonella bovis]
MAKTKKLAMELPLEGRFISVEFPITREDLITIDQAVSDLDEKANSKVPLQHTHVINQISGLEDVLNSKMAADKTFALVDLTDVKGAKDATENHVLYKSGKDRFAFDSVKSLLGEHQHTIEDITDLDEYIATINVDLKDYGCLSGKNEWEDTNVFKENVSIEEGIELAETSSLTLKQNDKVVTNLNATGSLLKGPLKVDDELVYTKPQLDEAMSKEMEKLKQSLPNESTSCSELADAELFITQSGKIKWPDWVTQKTKVEIQAWGGGGSGGSAKSNDYPGGGGGGSGCVVWYGYKASLNGHENIIIGSGAEGNKQGSGGSSGGHTIIGNNFIAVAGGGGGGAGTAQNVGVSGYGSRGDNFGLVTDESPGLVRACNGYSGGHGEYKQRSGFGGNAGNSIKGKNGGQGTGTAHLSGVGGAGYGGGGAGARGANGSGGKGADGAVLIRLWKN